MAGKPRYQNRIEILQGTLDLLILQTLPRCTASKDRAAPPRSVDPAVTLRME